MVDTSLYVTLSRQTAISRELEVVANNLANLSTTAYKAERMLFDKALKQAGASDPVSFVIDRATYTDHKTGAIIETKNDLDVAILGQGYLAVETPQGQRLTRDGRMVVASSGELTALDGSPILDDSFSPIQIPDEASRIAIASDGTVNVDGADLGRIGIFNVEDTALLVRDAGGRFRSERDPEPLERPNLKQGAIEASNVDPIREITRLIDLSRAYEQSASMTSNIHDQKKGAIDRLGSIR